MIANISITPRLRKKLSYPKQKLRFKQKYKLSQTELDAILYVWDQQNNYKSDHFEWDDDLAKINIHYLLCKTIPKPCRGCTYYQTNQYHCKLCTRKKEV